MSLKLRVIGPSTTFAVVVVLLVSAAAAAARPTVTLTPACHDGTNPYAFTVSLSGFPPSLPFDARVRYSDINHDYIGLIATDAAGAYGPVGFGALTPLGRVSATITASIDGASQTFTADLSNPCFPPLGLRRAMCGDGNYRTYGFHRVQDCYSYIERLEHGRSTPTLTLIPACEQATAPFGFTVLVLGLPPGTSLTSSLSYAGQSLQATLPSDRFGVVGPFTFTSPLPVGDVTATVTGGGQTLTATLNNPCITR